MRIKKCRLGRYQCVIGVAESFADRLFGLLLRKPEVDSKPLYFPNCHAIHTLGMRHELDLIFIDETKVLQVERNVRPGRLWVGCSSARSVIEIFSAYAEHDIRVGDPVLIEAN